MATAADLMTQDIPRSDRAAPSAKRLRRFETMLPAHDQAMPHMIDAETERQIHSPKGMP